MYDLQLFSIASTHTTVDIRHMHIYACRRLLSSRQIELIVRVCHKQNSSTHDRTKSTSISSNQTACPKLRGCPPARNCTSPRNSNSMTRSSLSTRTRLTADWHLASFPKLVQLRSHASGQEKQRRRTLCHLPSAHSYYMAAMAAACGGVLSLPAHGVRPTGFDRSLHRWLDSDSDGWPSFVSDELKQQPPPGRQNEASGRQRGRS